jgi:hypothetical protein
VLGKARKFKIKGGRLFLVCVVVVILMYLVNDVTCLIYVVATDSRLFENVGDRWL